MAGNTALANRLAIPNAGHLSAVVVYHVSGRPPAKVLELFDERVPLRVIHERSNWHQTDLVVFTSGGLTVDRERLAARLGATYAVILPAQADWCMGEIAKRLQRGDVHIFLPHSGSLTER